MEISTTKFALAVLVAAGIGSLIVSKGILRPVVPVAVKAPTTVPLTGAQLCARDLTKFIQFNDPDSVKINSVEPNTDRPGRYWMSLSAKNGYGGYGAPIVCSCGIADSRVTDIHCSPQ